MKFLRWPIVILSLPIFLLLGWIFYEQFLITQGPLPRWVAEPNQSATFCEDIVNYNLRGVVPADDKSTAHISSAQGRAIIDQVLARYHHFFPSSDAYNSHLIWATYPDGQRRLSWYAVAMTEIDPLSMGMAGKASAVCVDAQTGEALMLIPDIYVGDPPMTCNSHSLTFPLSPRQIIAVGLLIIYLPFLALVVWTIWLIRRPA